MNSIYRAGHSSKMKLSRRFLACLTAALVTFSMTAAAAVPAFAAEKNIKEETVYVITDSAGSQQDVIVSDHLFNKDSSETISDVSPLTDIENVKGEEKFEKGTGNKITWQAEGNDIYYQGKTDSDVPVDVNVKYYLDGKQTTGEKLQGKSGDIRIEINYTNKKIVSSGVKVPFIVMTGFLVQDDCMKNIKVSSGKVIDDGEKTVVVGMAVPGLAESLDISSEKLGISDTIEITGKAEDFSLEDMMTIVTGDIFEDVDTSEFSSLDMDDQVKQLDTGARKLVKGTAELYDGIHLLYEKSGALQSGVSKLNTGAAKLDSGAASALEGSKELASGTKLFSGILGEKLGAMRDGASQLYTGSKQINSGITRIASGINGSESQTGLASAASAVSSGIDSIAAGVNGNGTADDPGLVKGTASVSAGIDELAGTLSGAGQSITSSVTDLETAKATLKQLASSVTDETQKKALEDAIAAIEHSESIQKTMAGAMSTDKISQLQAGAKEVSSGASQIAAGLNGNGTSANPGLVSGAESVAGGLASVQAGLNGDGTSANPGLVKGAASLETGAGSLAEGLGAATAEGTDENPSLTSSADALASGASQLAAGQKKLSSGASELADGMMELDSSAGTLISGVKKLDSGALQVQKGMKQLYKEGISKIVELYNSDLKGITSNIESVIDAGKNYKTFTQIPAGMDGNVKFIYKTKVSGE